MSKIRNRIAGSFVQGMATHYNTDITNDGNLRAVRHFQDVVGLYVGHQMIASSFNNAIHLLGDNVFLFPNDEREQAVIDLLQAANELKKKVIFYPRSNAKMKEIGFYGKPPKKITITGLRTLQGLMFDLCEEAAKAGRFPEQYRNSEGFIQRKRYGIRPFRCIAYNQLVRRINALKLAIGELVDA